MTTAARHYCPLFAEIFGSRALRETLGNAEALHAVERCFNRMERAIAAFKGRVARHSGDQLMAIFDSAVDAQRAACEMQQRVETLPAVSGVKLAIGVGFHYGPAPADNNDGYGETVNVAARLVKLAKDGQIVTSEATVAALPAALRDATRAIESALLRVNQEEIRVFAVVWQKPGEGVALPAVPGAAAPRAALPARLRLLHNGCELVMDATRPLVTMGRDTHCDLVIKDPRASRQHGRIERRRDVFVLVDQSSNGTFLSPEGESGRVLKHGEALLKGRGCLFFGQEQGRVTDEVVAYELLRD